MIAAVELGWQLSTPAWLWLIPLVLAASWWRHRRRPTVAFAAASLWQPSPRADVPFEPLPTTWRMRLSCLPALLELLALSALVLALAQPVRLASLPPERLGRDVLFCFDRSSSMAADDLAPGQNRLAVGKQLAAEFVARRRGDRIGFVTFARYADLGCPPTVDHDAVLELLQRVALVDAEGPEDATAIGAAVGMAADLLQRSSTPGKVIVLLTDGEENVAVAGAEDQIAPVQAGQWCRQNGIRVHTIVLGRGQALPDGRFAALDTTAVQQLAAVTGGGFFQATDEAALRAVYAAIDAVEAVSFAEPGVRIEAWFPLAIALGIALLFASHGLQCGRLGGVP